MKDEEDNKNILKENGLIPGGIMAMVLSMGLSIYFIRGLMDLMGETPAHSLTIEPIHLIDKHELEKVYTAYNDKFHWNFGFGFKKSIIYPDFNVLDNDYIKITGM